jgi:DNA-binding CsgD family transcriptional regulator
VSDVLVVLDRARLQVLRATVAISFLIAAGDLVGAIAGFTPTRRTAGVAIGLAVAWCVLWAVAVAVPRRTAGCFMRWRLTVAVLVAANAATVAVTGGIASPDLALCMYAGWIASVVVQVRPALLLSLGISGSVLAGYLLAGDSFTTVVTGPSRYAALANVVLPILAGAVGTLLATVANGILNRLGPILTGLRAGEPAATPGLTALLAGRPVLALAAGPSEQDGVKPAPPPGLTPAEREIVGLLGQGLRAKQIALRRGVKLNTVRYQIKMAKKKTGAKTISELVALTWDETT